MLGAAIHRRHSLPFMAAAIHAGGAIHALLHWCATALVRYCTYAAQQYNDAAIPADTL